MFRIPLVAALAWALLSLGCQSPPPGPGREESPARPAGSESQGALGSPAGSEPEAVHPSSPGSESQGPAAGRAGSEGEEAAGELVLDHGKPWKANPETTEGVRRMQALVDDYLARSHSHPDELAKSLESEFSDILKKCTMTGEAHNQLHHFLLPLRARIEKLKKDPSDDLVREIQSYLREYPNFFE